MDTVNTPLPIGYSKLPQGTLATVVTCLEMREKPPLRAAPSEADLSVVPWPSPDPEEYRALYRRVGEEWLWVSRISMEDEALRAILTSAAVEIFGLMRHGERIGLLELDFRKAGECELAFFGVDASAVGSGAGRILMNAAIDHAWSKPIDRFWVHTCHLDHPAALPFYQRSGFTVYDRMVEVFEDPRLSGMLNRDAGRHVPLIEA
ncbi:GNAT family N-acetyltransferase [Rhizobium sp. AAP43]|uniref:GNAT family N-acetyltransferase n=1 Tax=Rhizobium sp. AAP43 TaxID=1523420 RepID=UPI0006B8C79A|nr:GNAT family N-acetyltransferase [Rhizobium sp. AAP43]KPF44149.1 GCN5 family acetyltransferase [Rhizobium sp. AAP43]